MWRLKGVMLVLIPRGYLSSRNSDGILAGARVFIGLYPALLSFRALLPLLFSRNSLMQISVFGIGYVGAVSAACLANDGHNVIAVDPNPQKVGPLNEGISPIVEPGLDELFQGGIHSRRLLAT